MQRLHDPSLMSLPHPVRYDAVAGGAADTTLFEQFGGMGTLRPYLTDAHATSEWILNHVPGIRPLALAYGAAPGGVNLGNFMLILTRARLRAHGDPILQVTPALQAMLAETDLASGLPARFFRSPYPLAFIAFAQPNPLRVPNHLSGRHACEGAYVGIYTLAPHDEIHTASGRGQALGLDPSKPTRAIEIVIIGSPMGKAHALDDVSQNLTLLIQDEDACLSAVLDRHLPLFRSATRATSPGAPGFAPDEVAMVKPVVLELAKVLLYLNLAEAEQVRLNAREDLARRLRGLGQKKAARLQRRMATVYDRILIGPSTLPAAEEPGKSVPSEPHRGLRPHWRRGHFRRIRFGEGLSESRLGWIQPYLVKAAEAFACR